MSLTTARVVGLVVVGYLATALLVAIGIALDEAANALDRAEVEA